MLESILKRLEQTREKMVQSAIERGVSDEETIRLSEELDSILNEFQYEGKHNTDEEQIRN